METDTEDRGLICAYDLDGRGGARRLGWDDIAAQRDAGTVRWIHCAFMDPNAQRWIREEAGIDPAIAEALLDDESRPRIVEHGKGVLVILRGVNLNPGDKPEDMVSVRLWIEAERIVSTRRRKLMSVRKLRDDLESGSGPKDAADLLVSLVRRLGDRIEPVVEDVEDAIEQSEDRYEGDGVSHYRGEFSSLRRQAMRIRRFLAPQRTALDQLSRLANGLLSDAQCFAMREEADRLTLYLESLDLVRERAMVAQEELIAQLAQQQNSRIYILSLIAAVFLPLSFLTGLMGMNVAGLPGTNYPAAFAILVVLMAAVSVGIIAAFRWQKWL